MAQKSKETTAERIARKAEELKEKINDMRQRMERSNEG